MPKLLALFSSLVAGIGMVLGGLAMGGNKSESQIVYEPEVVVSREDDTSDYDLDTEEEDSPAGRVEGISVSEESAGSLEGVTGESIVVVSQREEEKCAYYAVRSSGQKKAESVDYSFVEKNVKDPVEKQEIEESCKKEKKVYIANLGTRGRGGWGYRPQDQKLMWSIVPTKK